MKKKEEDCEKLEQEVVSLRKSLRNSQVPKDLTHIGCMGETSYKEDANTNKMVEERATQTVDEKWTRIPKRGMITKEMNIQEDLLPSGIKEASISMKETTEE